MAAFESSWLRSMPGSSQPSSGTDMYPGNVEDSSSPISAAFSTHAHSNQRSTILLHQKSPLLLATPPQVTRALAYSHAFILPLNKLAGLLTWTTGDPWESFIFVGAFWFAVLYGDPVLRFGGPLVLVFLLVFGLYFRNYSPLSATGWTGQKKKKSKSEETQQSDSSEDRKSLDEILNTLQAFTGRCNILAKPVLVLADFLSTQQSATTTTTRPSLSKLFIRLLFVSPVWFLLTLPPLYIITTQRIIFVVGTLILTWHSRPARITRAIMWRSRFVRYLVSLLTGLDLAAKTRGPAFPSSNYTILKNSHSKGKNVRFTFTIYENQRRWIGLGWTGNMVAYERAPYTDEHMNPASSPESFQLPKVDGGKAKWQWVAGSSWHTESSPAGNGAVSTTGKNKDDDAAWVYYDNKWQNGARGADSWSKYTRRRKWVRDAELVDNDGTTVGADQASAIKKAVGTDTEHTPTKCRANEATSEEGPKDGEEEAEAEVSGTSMTTHKRQWSRSWFARAKGEPSTPPQQQERKKQHSRAASSSNSSMTLVAGADGVRRGKRDEREEPHTPVDRLRERESEWGLGDDASMELG